MQGKVALLTKRQLWFLMKKNKFHELFQYNEKKARDLFNDLWNKMTPTPFNANQKYLFEGIFKEWMFIVEKEIK